MTTSPVRLTGALACLVGVALAASGCGGSGKQLAGTAAKDAQQAAAGKATGGGNFCKLIASSLTAGAALAQAGSLQSDKQAIDSARAMGDAAAALAPSSIKGDVAVLIHAGDVMYSALAKNGYDYTKLTAADMAGFSAPQVVTAEKNVMSYVTGTCGLDPAALSASSSAGTAAAVPATTSTAPASAAPTTAAASAAPSTAPAAAQPPSTGADPAEAAGSACSLFTLAQVSAAAGKPMALSGGAGPICAYSAVGDPSLLLYVSTYADAGAMALMKAIDTDKTQDIPGLGDAAFWNDFAGTLFVQKGSRGFSVTSPGIGGRSAVPDPAVKARMVTLGRQGLAHL